MRSCALITGATGGLGKAFAAECASRGWNLFLTDVREPALAVLAEGLQRMHNAEVQYHPADMTDPASRARLWEVMRERHLRFHALINVAGIDFEGPFAERSLEELSTIIRLNVESVVAMTRAVLPNRDPTRTLRIIIVSSLAGFYAIPIKAVYAASKGFLLAFSQALRRELRDEDVSVTALCPAGMPSNPGVIEAIDAQGIMGWVTTRNVGYVAARTLDRALANRAVYVPGAINAAMRRVSAIVPRSVVTTLLARRWQKARNRRTSTELGLRPG